MTEPSNPLAPPASVVQIKAVINAFFQERLEPRLKKLKPEDEEGRQKLLFDNCPENWIPGAAQRVKKIQKVTHAIKYIHPEAKGSCFCTDGNLPPDSLFVGTHTLAGKLSLDVVCDAKQLDVYKFLCLPVGDKTLLDLIADNNPSVAKALSDDLNLARGWISEFACWAEGKDQDVQGAVASHKLAKQIYWPTAENDYHLLAPLFPTSLVHTVWEGICRDRFSEEAEAARNAKKARLAYPHGCREYPKLALQRFGGDSGKQNISQLNLKRRGENFLLPSLPPIWKSVDIRPPLAVNSIFDRIFGSRKRVRELVKALREFLVSVEHAGANIRIRNKRAELAGLIRDETFQYAAELRQLAPGWSASPECLLNSAEQCWLDPERTELDADFASLRQRGDWHDEICRRFGNWLNARLTTPNTPMGAVEAVHWRDVLDEEMRMMREEVADDE